MSLPNAPPTLPHLILPTNPSPPRAFITLSTKPESDTLRLLDNIAALAETYI